MPDPLSKRALDELLVTLRTQPEFIKVHAAEYLIWLGHTEEARKEFLQQNELHGEQPKYRIGIWRVLAQTEKEPSGKKKWNDKIFQAFGDLNGPDRLHASETLAKLHLSPLDRYPEATQKSLSDESRNLQVYTLWATSYASPDSLDKNRLKFIQLAAADTNEDVRKISSYILRRMGLNASQWKDFAKKALAEPPSSALKFSLLTTAFIACPADVQQDSQTKIKALLLNDYRELPFGGQIEVSMALAEHGTAEDIPVLAALMDSKPGTGISEAESADVRAAAAYAILKIKNRNT